ncbi:MAG: hypothetical protein ACI91F_003483 [Candidatus Binatia bacterium]|jgi:hypothetical protein
MMVVARDMTDINDMTLMMPLAATLREVWGRRRLA